MLLINAARRIEQGVCQCEPEGLEEAEISASYPAIADIAGAIERLNDAGWVRLNSCHARQMHVLYNRISMSLDAAMSRLDRNVVRVYRSHAAADDGGYMPGTAEERLSQVWDLTREVWFFCREMDAEQRLQRDVAVLIRRGR